MKPLFDYLVASRNELAKVSWPNRRQTVRLTIQVVVFSLIMAGILGTLDFLFQSIVAKLIS